MDTPPQNPSPSLSSSKGGTLRAYLCKKGHVVKNWKLRLFVLKYGSSYIEYFVDETKETQHQPQGKIPLFNCKVQEYVHNKNNNPREFCFIVETSESKSWIISASSKNQQQQWIESIREATKLAEEGEELKQQKHRQIERSILTDSKNRQRMTMIKLLLLGTGESGKSTIVKQMKILHSNGFTSEEKEFYRQLVQRNLLDGVTILSRVIVESDIEVATETKLAVNHYLSWQQIYEQRRPAVLRLKAGINITQSGSSSPSMHSPPSTPPTVFTLNDSLDLNQSIRSSNDLNSSNSSNSIYITPAASDSNNNNNCQTYQNYNMRNSYDLDLEQENNNNNNININSSNNNLLAASLNQSSSRGHSRNNSDSKSIYHVEENGIPSIICNYITTIWSDPVVQTEVLNRAQQYHIHESTQFYLNEIKRIAKSSYQPSSLDILKSRSQTNGVVETDFKVMEVLFRIVDVGGQRGERKKWISFFDDVTAIIFVAAINEYDQVLTEDNCTNRLHESLNLFDQVCNDPLFPKTSVILFLNKIDLFREKLKRVPLQICFPDYKDDQSYDKAANYIKNNFLGKKRGHDHTRHIYYHFTCATDTKSFETVFNSVQDIILSRTLELAVN